MSYSYVVAMVNGLGQAKKWEYIIELSYTVFEGLKKVAYDSEQRE